MNIAVYAALAALLRRISGKLGERISLTVYAAGLTGFALPEGFGPGPFRFKLCSAAQLSGADVALGLVRRRRRRSQDARFASRVRGTLTSESSRR